MYLKKLDRFFSIHFDLKLFIIIATLTYLLAYKLSDYIADFKTIKKKSRSDIIFLSIFFIMLFIPMSHINQKEISKNENRTLAEWEPLLKENYEINYNFGKSFNNWFNDRFLTRNELICLNRKIKILFSDNIYAEGSRYFNKKNYWAFNKDWVATNSYQKEFQKFEYNIRKLNDFCNRHGIKLYILIAPPTSEVYEKEFKETTGIKNIVNNGEDFAQYMKNKDLDIIVSPLKELIAAKNNNPYTKGDVHWNEYGAFIAYQKLMKRIKHDFPKINILKEDDFKITKDIYSQTDYMNYPTEGNLYRELQIDKKYLNTEYSHFEYKGTEEVKRTKKKIDYSDENTYNKNSINPQTVYMIGNSYEECLAEFIIPSFKQVVKVRFNNYDSRELQMSRFEDDILKNKPNILILVILSNETQLKNLYTE